MKVPFSASLVKASNGHEGFALLVTDDHADAQGGRLAGGSIEEGRAVSLIDGSATGRLIDRAGPPVLFADAILKLATDAAWPCCCAVAGRAWTDGDHDDGLCVTDHHRGMPEQAPAEWQVFGVADAVGKSHFSIVTARAEG